MTCTKIISAEPCHIEGKMVLAPCTYYECEEEEPEVQSSVIDHPGFQAFLIILALVLLGLFGFGLKKRLKKFDVTFTWVWGLILIGAVGGFSATRNTTVPDLEGQNSENRAAALPPV